MIYTGGHLMDVKDYMNLSYTVIVKKINDESGTYWYSSILELDGCQSTGETEQEAIDNLKEAQEGWIEAKLAKGLKIPLPDEKDNMEYSGKFNIRIPKELHRKLALQAELQKVSLNQYVLYKLAM
jgi:predicted RNase H-like HicB family nuclease